jgi:hypothetical protein
VLPAFHLSANIAGADAFLQCAVDDPGVAMSIWRLVGKRAFVN